eukprot:TRINITY_DN23372_c0_g1_i1.p1 TRINITY_DN23372_c0_g1~~TRINITY_DN23372_c0_g1_i1.p1  ORF type:complete len:172 (-),score=33.54 TRINITY_DN23372_c0_g1_i1:13-528(-)
MKSSWWDCRLNKWGDEFLGCMEWKGGGLLGGSWSKTFHDSCHLEDQRYAMKSLATLKDGDFLYKAQDLMDRYPDYKQKPRTDFENWWDHTHWQASHKLPEYWWKPHTVRLCCEGPRRQCLNMDDLHVAIRQLPLLPLAAPAAAIALDARSVDVDPRRSQADRHARPPGSFL